MKTCGDFGGKRKDGEPCQLAAGWGRKGVRTGPCKSHSDEAAESREQEKRTFLEALAEGTVTMDAAAMLINRNQATVWSWRQTDPQFDADVRALQHQVDQIRIAMAEDSLFGKIADRSASAAEIIFFLVNRAPDRWKHVQRVEHTGREGTPLEVAVREVIVERPDLRVVK